MHHHITGKGNGQVITKTLLTESGGQMQSVPLLQFLITHLIQEISAVENFEKQLITFLAVLTHQSLQRFHGRCFNLLEPIKSIDTTYRVEYIVALCHLYRREVACSFRNTWFHKDNE